MASVDVQQMTPECLNLDEARRLVRKAHEAWPRPDSSLTRALADAVGSLADEVGRLREELRNRPWREQELCDQRNAAEAEASRLRAAIRDIDSHATPLAEDEDGYAAMGYVVAVGAIHRALGLAMGTGVPCAMCGPGSHDCPGLTPAPSTPSEPTPASSELERLRAALKKYGRHLRSCLKWGDPGAEWCDCGLVGLLDEHPVPRLRTRALCDGQHFKGVECPSRDCYWNG